MHDNGNDLLASSTADEMTTSGYEITTEVGFIYTTETIENNTTTTIYDYATATTYDDGTEITYDKTTATGYYQTATIEIDSKTATHYPAITSVSSEFERTGQESTVASLSTAKVASTTTIFLDASATTFGLFSVIIIYEILQSLSSGDEKICNKNSFLSSHKSSKLSS